MAKNLATNPDYILLVTMRRRLAFRLTAVILLAYYSFIAVIAFKPDVLGVPIGGGVMTLGIPLGIGLILLSIGLTGYYVYVSNKVFDPLMDRIRKNLK